LVNDGLKMILTRFFFFFWMIDESS
jgi:hypothetical protein